MSRAWLNQREAPSEIVTARAPWTLSATAWRFTCPRFNFADAPVKKSNLIRFGSLHFRDNWEWPVTMCGGTYVVHLFKQKVGSQKKRSFGYHDTAQQHCVEGEDWNIKVRYTGKGSWRILQVASTNIKSG